MISFLVILLFLSSCGPKSLYVDKNFKYTDDHQGGIAVMSQNWSTLGKSYGRLDLASPDGEVLYIDEILVADEDKAFYVKRAEDFSNPKGQLYVMDLKPGKYLIFRYMGKGDWKKNQQGQLRRWYESTDVDIPFEIKKGEIAYLGNFTINRRTKMGKSYELKILDQQTRDISLAKKRFASLAGLAVKNKVIQLKTEDCERAQCQ